jgi:hypothetical protein
MILAAPIVPPGHRGLFAADIVPTRYLSKRVPPPCCSAILHLQRGPIRVTFGQHRPNIYPFGRVGCPSDSQPLFASAQNVGH